MLNRFGFADLYDVLFRVFDLVSGLGMPLVLAAWITVFGGVLAMGWVVRGALRRFWVPFAAVVLVSLAAHMLDYFLTLAITPDLSLEGNPLWRGAVTAFGLPLAKAYGFTGKILASLLAGQFYVLYCAQRERLFPAEAQGFGDFLRRYGNDDTKSSRLSWRRPVNFFSFLFALFGPYFFYVSLINAAGSYWAHTPLFERLPSPIPAIVAYLLILTVAYFGITYRAFQRQVVVTERA